MAVNPEMKEFLKDVWTLAIENSSSGAISKTESDKSEAPSAYLQTYRVKEEGVDPLIAAPILSNEGVIMFEKFDTETIDFDANVNIYVKALSADGELRINL